MAYTKQSNGNRDGSVGMEKAGGASKSQTTVRRFGVLAIVTTLMLVSLFVSNASAFSCGSTACIGKITELVAKTNGNISVKLDGAMVIQGVSCGSLTLRENVESSAGYKNIASALLKAQTTGEDILIRPDDRTCDIQFITLRPEKTS